MRVIERHFLEIQERYDGDDIIIPEDKRDVQDSAEEGGVSSEECLHDGEIPDIEECTDEEHEILAKYCLTKQHSERITNNISSSFERKNLEAALKQARKKDALSFGQSHLDRKTMPDPYRGNDLDNETFVRQIIGALNFKDDIEVESNANSKTRPSIRHWCKKHTLNVKQELAFKTIAASWLHTLLMMFDIPGDVNSSSFSRSVQEISFFFQLGLFLLLF